MLVALLGVLTFARPALAASTSSCSSSANTSTVFSAWGDPSFYTPVPGGSFESTTQKWTLKRDSVVPGNEPWYVTSTTDTDSLSLTTGGMAQSPAICVNASRPWWRFFATSHSGSVTSTLTVWAGWTNSNGTKGTTPVTTLLAGNYQSWALTPQLVLGAALGSGVKVTAHLYFSTSGKWQIDDVYIDPYAK